MKLTDLRMAKTRESMEHFDLGDDIEVHSLVAHGLGDVVHGRAYLRRRMGSLLAPCAEIEFLVQFRRRGDLAQIMSASAMLLDGRKVGKSGKYLSRFATVQYDPLSRLEERIRLRYKDLIASLKARFAVARTAPKKTLARHCP